jgi:outer membrane lipoprotein-sorting protein
MRFLALTLALTPFAAVALWQNSFDDHVKKLQEAQSLSMTLTTSVIGGTTEDVRVTLSKPNLMRIDSSAQLITTNGKQIWIYDKSGKTYEDSPVDAGSPASVWLQENAWVYTAFFNEKLGDQIASATKGNSRKLRNVAVTDWTITRKDKAVLLVQMDDQLGVVRGFRTTKDKAEVFVFAKELKIGDTPIAESEFVFVAPAGVTKKEAGAPAGGAALTFADIKPILDANCIGCHSGGGAKKGVVLSSYQEVAKHVTPGDPDSSRMIRPVKRGMMPPGRPLPADTVAKLEAWVKAGAKP